MGRSSYLQAAFDHVCKDARTVETWYVSLMEKSSFYGGAEEGGWWGTDHSLVAYQEFPNEELARAAAEQVEKLAEELQDNSRRDYGDHCNNQLDWLNARGLDADYLPENDGPSEFYVHVGQGIPNESRGSRQWD